jgi:imidazolonepropionase-like amidohydrolase
LKTGLQADILVVDGDATTDIEALRNVRQVFLAGAEV